MGKQNMYDHSMRPPLLVAGPGISKGKSEKMEVYLQDLMPTAIEYAGGEVPEWVEFNSLRPIIEGEQVISSYPEIYGAYMDLQRMIRMDDYKMIVYPRAGVIKIFDLINDPSEMYNLAGAVSQKERILMMFGKLQELQVTMGDTLDLSNYKFNL
jgi:arylsulfatase A-like enzyme